MSLSTAPRPRMQRLRVDTLSPRNQEKSHASG